MQEDVPRRFRPSVPVSDRSYVGNWDREIDLPDEKVEWLRDIVQEIATRLGILKGKLEGRQSLLEDTTGMAHVDREGIREDIDDIKTSLLLLEKLQPHFQAELAEWERQADADKTHFEKEALEARTRRHN